MPKNMGHNGSSKIMPGGFKLCPFFDLGHKKCPLGNHVSWLAAWRSKLGLLFCYEVTSFDEGAKHPLGMGGNLASPFKEAAAKGNDRWSPMCPYTYSTFSA